jgi:hypothetical protein
MNVDMNAAIRAAAGRAPDRDAQRHAADEAWRRRVRAALDAREREVAHLRAELDRPHEDAHEPVPSFDGGARGEPITPTSMNERLRAAHEGVGAGRAGAIDDVLGGHP